MMKKKIVCAVFLALLVGCGGGGGGKDENDGTLSPREISKGIFLDSLVEGLGYRTPSFSGMTNSAGEYSYLPDEMVTFFIGDIVLGTVKAGPVVTPLTLVPDASSPTDPVVTNIVRLLLSLDDDRDPINGIRITTDATKAAEGLSVDFTEDDLELDAGVDSLLDSFVPPRDLVDESTAQTHFSETLATQSIWGTMIWGNGSFRKKS